MSRSPAPLLPLELSYKPDAAEAQQRLRAYWQGELVDRACIGIRAPKEGAPGGKRSLIVAEDFDFPTAIDRFEQSLASQAACQMFSGDFAALESDQWKVYAADHTDLCGRLYRLMTEPHRRWSAGFSCLCFAWVGAPLAIRLRNTDFLTSFFLCFLPILVVYYPLLAYGVDGAKGGSIPPYSVWAGNLFLLPWGGRLLWKVLRY